MTTSDPSQVSANTVDTLIGAARGHELGLEFLRVGSLDAVSAVFEVHAFVIEAARERLGSVEIGVAAHASPAAARG